MNGKIIEVDFLHSNKEREYVDSLKKIAEQIKQSSDEFNVEMRDYFQDLNYLVVAEDIAEQLEQDQE